MEKWKDGRVEDWEAPVQSAKPPLFHLEFIFPEALPKRLERKARLIISRSSNPVTAIIIGWNGSE
jgi:hypothetical protein